MPADLPARVLALLASHGPLTARECSRHVSGLKPSAALQALENLEARGEVSRGTRRAKRGPAAVTWRIGGSTDAPMTAAPEQPANDRQVSSEPGNGKPLSPEHPDPPSPITAPALPRLPKRGPRLGGHLFPAQWRALEALAIGKSQGEVAKAAGVSTRTIRAWMGDNEHFKREHDRLAGMQRQRVEALTLNLAEKSALRVTQALDKPKDALEAARIGLGSAVRVLARYKQVSGEVRVPPILIMPPGTRMKTLREFPQVPGAPPTGPIIDVEGGPVDEQP